MPVSVATVLIVAEDREAAATSAFHLAAAGYRVRTARDGAEAIAVLRRQVPALLVLHDGIQDVTLPELLRRLRAAAGTRAVPALVRLAHGADAAARVDLLLAGADDCVATEVDSHELVARVEALLRRAGAPPTAPALHVGAIEIDVAAHAVRVAERPVELTPMEFSILRTLAEHAGRLRTHEELAVAIWGGGNKARRGTNGATHTRSLTVQVSRLRAKLGDAADVLETVRGLGYRLRSTTPSYAPSARRAVVARTPNR
jgi:two-component system, OmpR family, phosphate regulon response regulator PhoB